MDVVEYLNGVNLIQTERGLSRCEIRLRGKLYCSVEQSRFLCYAHKGSRFRHSVLEESQNARDTREKRKHEGICAYPALCIVCIYIKYMLRLKSFISRGWYTALRVKNMFHNLYPNLYSHDQELMINLVRL